MYLIIQSLLVPEKGTLLTKKVKDLYTENYKTVMKDIEEETNKWKDIPCLWIGRIYVVKMFVPPKALCRFSAFGIQCVQFHWNSVQFQWHFPQKENKQL